MTSVTKADPLSVLRHYRVHGLEFEEDEKHVIFGEFAFTKNAKTTFFHYVINNGVPGEDNRKVKEYYTLDCLLFLIKHVDIPWPQYVRLALSLKIPTIRRPDRRAVLAYLNGEITSTPSIDQYGPIEIPVLMRRSVDGRKVPTRKISLPEMKNLRKRMSSVDATESEKKAVGKRSSLTDVLSAEQIAAIKAKASKRMAKRKKLMAHRRHKSANPKNEAQIKHGL